MPGRGFDLFKDFGTGEMQNSSVKDEALLGAQQSACVNNPQRILSKNKGGKVSNSSDSALQFCGALQTGEERMPA